MDKLIRGNISTKVFNVHNHSQLHKKNMMGVFKDRDTHIHTYLRKCVVKAPNCAGRQDTRSSMAGVTSGEGPRERRTGRCRSRKARPKWLTLVPRMSTCTGRRRAVRHSLVWQHVDGICVGGSFFGCSRTPWLLQQGTLPWHLRSDSLFSLYYFTGGLSGCVLKQFLWLDSTTPRCLLWRINHSVIHLFILPSTCWHDTLWSQFFLLCSTAPALPPTKNLTPASKEWVIFQAFYFTGHILPGYMVEAATLTLLFTIHSQY